MHRNCNCNALKAAVLLQSSAPSLHSGEQASMATSDQSASVGNLVEGFSARFNLLMDRAAAPKKARISYGAKRFGVAINTFKSWCVADRIPGAHSDLVAIVDELVKDMPGRCNSRAVVAWLLAGDAVPNPFADDTDALTVVELYLQIIEIARRERIELSKLPREVQNRILKHVLRYLRASCDGKMTDAGIQLDPSAVTMVIGMLDAASVSRERPRDR